MAIKIVGPIKELTEREDRIGWVSPAMDDSIGMIFQEEDFEKATAWRVNVDTYIPKFNSFSYSKRWVLDTENIRSDWFKHE